MTSVWGSLQAINQRPWHEKQAIYAQLIPDWVFTRFHIDRQHLTQDGVSVVSMHCPAGSRALEMSVYHMPGADDPLLYINMIDTFNFQLLVLLVMINDPGSPRYHIDRDMTGDDTVFGTRTRNISEEIKAKEAGLAPGQVRHGLRAFKTAVPVFEAFVSQMGHALFLIEPLAYHNAVVFERYGFAYTHGLKEMQRIHEGFQPGGVFHAQLTPDNPFRQPEAWQTIRGRSWAIHDGILGHPYTGFQMYKRLGHHAHVNTFPDGRW